MGTPDFAELVGDEDGFFSHHHNKSSLLRHGALAGGATRELLSIADLDVILHHEALRSLYLRVVKNGAQAPERTYTSVMKVRDRHFDDCVVPEQVYERFRAGATLVWNSMNHFLPTLRALSHMMSHKLATRADVTAFLTPAHERGFSVHHDAHDAYIIQVEGTKRWQVWPTPTTARRAEAGPPYDIGKLGEHLFETSLQPGDFLYIPYGTPHVASAEDEISLHLTVIAHHRPWSALIKDLIGRIADADPDLRGAPHLDDHLVEDQANVLEEQTRRLIERLRELDFRAETRRLIAQGRATPGTDQGRFLQETAAIDRIRRDTVVADGGGHVTFLETTDQRMTVQVGGNRVAMPIAVATALQAFGPGKTALAGKFVPDLPPDRSVHFVKTLIRLGALRTVG